MTYKELNDLADKLAQHLQYLGVASEVKVGICLEYSLDMIIAVLGVLKAGGAYIPLDPAYPQERLAFMLEDAQIGVLLTQQHLLDGLPKHNAKVVCLDKDWQELQISRGSVVTKIDPDNIAYTIYTSGSTDKPKGVMVTHRSLVNAYYAWEKVYELRSQDIHLQMASISFDVFAGNLVRALCSGAKLVLGSRELLLTPDGLYQLMQQEKVNCAEFVPAVLRNLLKYLEQTKQSLEFMRLPIVGSDNWYVKEHQILQHFCHAQIRPINSYGLTEATIDTTYFHSETDLSTDKLVPIGRPFPNNQIYILDSSLQPVPIAVPGELYIGGVGLARGYHQRPDLTAQKFIPHPYSSNPGDRLYKTGDLVRYLSDGNIEFLGRIDHQVKIRGFRIELGEIEAVLNRHPAVQESVVMVREDEPGNKQLVAYFVSQQKSLKSSEIRNFLKEKLPSQMLPSTFTILERFPITPNGKIDRRALPKPDQTRPGLEAEFVAPQNSIEETLVSIWSEVLGVKQVGIYDNFFELGGDSIISISAIALANQKGLRLTPKQLFQHQTIAELATVVDRAEIARSEQGLVIGSVPLTPIQHWFFGENFLDLHHWNQSLLLEVRQDVDSIVLEKAVQQLLVHHDALRLKFRRGEGWEQSNAGLEATVPFSQIDLSTLPETEQKIALEMAAEQLQASLDLSAGMLLKVAFFNLGRSHRLLIIIHHLAVDGVSWRILLADLQTAYQQLINRQAIALPPKTTSFKQWAEKLPEYAKSAALESELDFWYEQLATLSPLPVDYPEAIEIAKNSTSSLSSAIDPSPRLSLPASPHPSAIGVLPSAFLITVATAKTVTVELSIEETLILLKEVPTAYRAQINDLLLTALVFALTQWTGNCAIAIDLESHGREEIFADVNLSRTVGWFTAVFPVLFQLPATNELGEVLKAVKTQLRRISNRGIGYGMLRYLNQKSKLSGLPSPNISFNYLGQFDQSFTELFSLAKESHGSPYSKRGNRSYWLEIDGFVANDRLQMTWTYSETLHQKNTIENLAENFRENLRSLIAQSQSVKAQDYIPTDFPLASLTQDELTRAFGAIEFEEV